MLQPPRRVYRPNIQKPREWGSIIKALAANFEHLMGTVRQMAKAHNANVDEFLAFKDDVNENLDELGAFLTSASIGDLDDVDLDGLSNGDTIRWNATTQRFEAGA